jgi:hypothetical protein
MPWKKGDASLALLCTASWGVLAAMRLRSCTTVNSFDCTAGIQGKPYGKPTLIVF